MTRLQKPPILASIFGLMGVFILLSLGTWQANKYIAKTRHAEDDACSRQTAVLVNAQYTMIDGDYPFVHCRDKIAIQGRLNKDVTIAVGPRVHDGKPGYHIYKPLIGLDYTTMLVNFGWSETKDLPLTSKGYTVIGNAYKPSSGNYFTPDNRPEKNEWYALDIAKITNIYDFKNLSPYVFFAKTLNPNDLAESFVTAEISKTYLKPETHLQYASFWYFMALALAVIFVLRFMVTKKAD